MDSGEDVLAGRYRVGALLGRGGSACVFDGYDLRLGRPVAIKQLRAEAAADPAMRRRFEQEARTAARLSHAHAVAVYDTGRDGDQSFLVMERLPGSSLADRIAEGPLDPEPAAAIGLDVLSALQAAHALGMVHRDVKPGNILLTEDGRAKVADFGIAKSADPPLIGDTTLPDVTALGLVIGTPAYLAPERLTGQPATARADLYAVGVVLYEMLTGTKPPPGPREVPGVPAALAAVVVRALSPNPVGRFVTACEMASALRRATGVWGGAVGTHDPAIPVPAAGPDDATVAVRSWRAPAGWWHRAARSRPALLGALLGIAAIGIAAVVVSGAATGRHDAGLRGGTRAAGVRSITGSTHSATTTTVPPAATADAGAGAATATTLSTVAPAAVTDVSGTAATEASRTTPADPEPAAEAASTGQTAHPSPPTGPAGHTGPAGSTGPPPSRDNAASPAPGGLHTKDAPGARARPPAPGTAAGPGHPGPHRPPGAAG